MRSFCFLDKRNNSAFGKSRQFCADSDNGRGSITAVFITKKG
eukprot:CAMPEP_0168293094 /NCGR_PEP_ID=MMETSP0142_2-20121227/7646_1 /TAXON_ID=44445 /ORGANISM="Pseudo-nitzschia australis, Strain 10249 10 AB" /LENGTH=41 /DNA_ID= /DNA_START= /DNA_END= /DNA_ORIENTATION=